MNRAGHVAGRPLVLVSRIDHGDGLRAQDPLRQVLDVFGLDGRRLPPPALPRIHAYVEAAGHAVEPDSLELALGVSMLRVATAYQHDRPAARDQPSHPRAERAAQADAVAARDVAPVVAAP